MAFQNCADPLPDEAKNMSFGVPTRFSAGEPFSANKLPYLPQGNLVSELDAYLSTTGFKAVAIAPNGYGVARGHSRLASQAEANKYVLEACQIVARNMPCGLFAEGNVIKYNEADFFANQVSVLEFGPRSLDIDKIPALPDYNKAAFKTTYESPVTAKAVANGNFGLVVRGVGETQAEANRRGLESCEAIRPNETCTLYAIGNTVVFNVTDYNWNYTTSHIKYAPLTYAANQVPFVTDATRALPELTGIPAQATAGRNPVLALSRVGHFGVAAVTGATLAANRTAALAACNAKLSATSTIQCFVYSENNQVVMTKATLTAGNSP